MIVSEYDILSGDCKYGKADRELKDWPHVSQAATRVDLATDLCRAPDVDEGLGNLDTEFAAVLGGSTPLIGTLVRAIV